MYFRDLTPPLVTASENLYSIITQIKLALTSFSCPQKYQKAKSSRGLNMKNLCKIYFLISQKIPCGSVK